MVNSYIFVALCFTALKGTDEVLCNENIVKIGAVLPFLKHWKIFHNDIVAT